MMLKNSFRLEERSLNASRFIAFYDAMLAIIMTLIVLELEIPDSSHLFRLIPAFICYGISFFWLGFMWISSYTAWKHLEKVSPRTLFFMLFSLFFSSFFPFSTTLVVENFMSKDAQVFYVSLVLLITLSNYMLTQSMNRDHSTPILETLFMIPMNLTLFDLVVKFLGLGLSYFVWPPFGTISIFIAVIVLTIKLFIDSKVHCQMNCNLEPDSNEIASNGKER